MEYEDLNMITKDEVETILSKQVSDSVLISKVIVSSLKYIDDLDWLENLCIKYIKYNDYWVQKNALNGLGDLVRIYGKLNNLNCINILLDELNVEKPILKGEIDNLKDDIAIFNKSF